MRKQIPTTHTNLDLTNIDHIPSSVTLVGSNAMLYVFEDNEAVLKMIIKGRSPTIRHVSRTHRVALDWLCDRINLVSKIQIRFTDTKHQLADIFDKRAISHVTHGTIFFFCSQSFSLTSCTGTMAKRMQEQEGVTRNVATSKPTMNMASFVSTSSWIVQNAVENPGDTQSTLSNRFVKYRETWRERTQSRRSVEFSRMVLAVGMRKLVATEEDQEHQNYPEVSVCTRKLVASGNWETEGSDKVWPHNLHVSTNYLMHMEKVFPIARQRYGLSPTDQMKDFDVKTVLWVIFMSVTLQRCSSFWLRLHSKSEIYQESTQEIFETVVKSDCEVDHGSDRNNWTDHDWLAAAHVERDDSADWQSCSGCNCPNLRPFWLSAMSGRYHQYMNQSKHVKAR